MQTKLHQIYHKNKMETSSGKGIEIAVLEMANARLRECKGSWCEGEFSHQLDRSLRFNQRIWDVFQSEWSQAECQIPPNLKANLLSLSVFVRKTTFSIFSTPSPDKIDSLIQINENLTLGLRGIGGDKHAASPSNTSAP